MVLQDREFVELDMAYNGAPNKPSETPPPSPDPSLTSLDRRKGTGCCGRRFSPHRRFLVKVSERPKGNPKWLRDEQPCCSNHKWPENHYLWTRCISSAPVINQANQNRHINKQSRILLLILSGALIFPSSMLTSKWRMCFEWIHLEVKHFFARSAWYCSKRHHISIYQCKLLHKTAHFVYSF